MFIGEVGSYLLVIGTVYLRGVAENILKLEIP